MLQDPDMDVRAEAIRYFCLRAKSAEMKLVEFLDSADYQIVLAAVHYLTNTARSIPTWSMRSSLKGRSRRRANMRRVPGSLLHELSQ
jgi:hypothetical protein